MALKVKAVEKLSYEEAFYRDCCEDVSSRAHSIRNGDYHHELHGSRTRHILSIEGRPSGRPLCLRFHYVQKKIIFNVLFVVFR